MVAMQARAIVFDLSEKERKKFPIYLFGTLISSQLMNMSDRLPNGAGVVVCCLCLIFSFLCLRFAYPLLGRVEMNQFGIFRYNSAFLRHSLAWNDISGVTVDRERQQLTVTGKPKGKTRPVSIIVRCPDGELDDVLRLLTEKLPPAIGETLPSSSGILSAT